MTENELRMERMKRLGFGPEIMKETRVCRLCGSVCMDKDSYCPDCGAVLPKETLFDMYKAFHIYCPDCNTVVSDSSVFCPECGRLLKKNIELQETKQGGIL